MNVKRFFGAGLAASALFALLQYIGPDVYLQQEYEETWYLWRSRQEVILPAVLLAEVVYGFLFAWFCIKIHPAPRLRDGLRFGIYATWFVVVPAVLFNYGAQPIPPMLVAKWLALGLGTNMVLGAVVALIYGRPTSAG